MRNIGAGVPDDDYVKFEGVAEAAGLSLRSWALKSLYEAAGFPVPTDRLWTVGRRKWSPIHRARHADAVKRRRKLLGERETRRW